LRQGAGTAASSVRALTPGERAMAVSVFGRAFDCDSVRIHRAKWFPLQPKRTIMAPDGHIWVPPESGFWTEDYASATPGLQGLFIHEMTHVWQAQTKGRWYLVLMRHPFCRYRYEFREGQPFERYGLEQQAEIVRHVFLQRSGYPVAGAPPLDRLEAILPFKP